MIAYSSSNDDSLRECTMPNAAIRETNPARAPVVFSHVESESTQLAKLLDIADPNSCSDVRLAQRVAGGLSPSAVTAMARVFGGNTNRIVGPIVPEATFRRAKKAGKLSKQHSERLYEIGRVLVAVIFAYRGDQDRVEAFLTRPHPLLAGESPLGMACSSSAGADAVLNLIRRAEAGVSP